MMFGKPNIRAAMNHFLFAPGDYLPKQGWPAAMMTALLQRLDHLTGVHGLPADRPSCLVAVQDGVASSETQRVAVLWVCNTLAVALPRRSATTISRHCAPPLHVATDWRGQLVTGHEPIRAARLDPPPAASPQQAAVYRWIATGERGGAADALCDALYRTGLGERRQPPPPLDGEDFRRCARFLAAVPGSREHLSRVAALSPAWAALVEHWSELERELARGGRQLHAQLRHFTAATEAA